jgi:agmatine/peptidylarginine deiminase
MKRLIAEFEAQSFTQIIFPHQDTDWKEYLQEAQKCFVDIINAIRSFQPCLVVCNNTQEVQKHFDSLENLFLVSYATDDTWARDCSALCVQEEETITLYDFTFNAWGEKFRATQDNLLTRNLSQHYTQPIKEIEFILEGGAIESNGKQLLLTTTSCMCNPNRNTHLTQEQITSSLKEFFGAKEILYLNHGYLAGDDTDSHIDTLVRFIDKNTLMYVKCDNTQDEHYQELYSMEKELEIFAQKYSLTLIPLPFASACYYQGERLPATYANFLFVNGGVLVPIYGVEEDTQALAIFEKTFPTRRVVPIDASVLIRQHGSLHCVTMNFARGVDLI